MTLELPKIGLGTMLAKSSRAKKGLIAGMKIGFRFIDTAQVYFNEKTVGEAIKESGIPREEFIIATKLFVTNFRPWRVSLTTKRSLMRLGIDSIDILYLHWPYRFRKVGETLKAMNKLIKEEKIKHIAVSNYTPEQVDKAQSLSETPIVANQVEMHPWLQQEELLEHHKKKNIHVVAYYPLMHGNIHKVPELEHISRKHNVSPYQVSLAWIMEKGAIPIPKSANPNHLQDNYNATKLQLDDEDIKLIDTIKIQKRLVKPPIISPDW